MKIRNLLFLLLFFNADLFAQNKKSVPAYLEMAPVVNALNMIMIHDVINPPAAARYYAYAMLGAYDIVSQNHPKAPSLTTFIKQFPTAQITVPAKNYDYRIAAVYCILETSKNMLPSGVALQEDEDTYLTILSKSKINPSIVEQSVAVAKEVSARIVNFSKNDNYRLLSAKLRYTPKKGDAYWYPTPPAYFEAVEPNWRIIRPMVIDSCTQFKPVPPVKFSTEKGSAFYKLAKEVYDVCNNPTEEEQHIAAFWDCNPFAVTTSGHMSIGFKKISPGGHWMNIAALAVEKANLNFDSSILVVTLESVTLMDCFIGCWDEKYRSERVRPETYINKFIDINWKPLLQTPPFPEYTSGHAVVSNSSATMLTYLLGDHFAYTDDTEIPFGVEQRSFTSFNQAAAEASISRLYGGIHFRDSIEEGNKQGRDVAENIIEKIKKAGINPQNNN